MKFLAEHVHFSQPLPEQLFIHELAVVKVSWYNGQEDIKRPISGASSGIQSELESTSGSEVHDNLEYRGFGVLKGFFKWGWFKFS